MPHLKALWPELPPLPDRMNIYETIIGQPQHDEWPDFTVHLEEETGKTRTFKELKKDIDNLATTLAGPMASGGLGLKEEDGERIGIMSDNSSVRGTLLPLGSPPYSTCVEGLCCPRPCAYENRGSFRVYLVLFHTLRVEALPRTLQANKAIRRTSISRQGSPVGIRPWHIKERYLHAEFFCRWLRIIGRFHQESP